jgi:hypothetical protein
MRPVFKQFDLVDSRKCSGGSMKRKLISILLLVLLPVWAGATWYDPVWHSRIKITVPSGTVTAALTNFPVYLNITNSALKSALSTGADFRITSSNETTELPLQVVSFNKSTGALTGWFKSTLSNVADNVFYLYWGNGSATMPAADSTYGSQAVWNANYQRVYNKSDWQSASWPITSVPDQTSNASAMAIAGFPVFYSTGNPVSTGDTAVSQGCYFDGTTYYLIGTNKISTRTSLTGSDVLTQLDPHTAINGGTDHLGAGMVYGNYLYIPAEHYVDQSTFSNQYITLWNKSDLTLHSKIDVSAQGAEVAALWIDPTAGTNGIIYMAAFGYTNPSTIKKYDLSDFSYLGEITMSTTYAVQGITGDATYFYMNGGGNTTKRYLKNGTQAGVPIILTGYKEVQSIQLYNGSFLIWDAADGGGKMTTYSTTSPAPSPLGQPIFAGNGANNYGSITYTHGNNGTISYWMKPKAAFYNYNVLLDSNAAAAQSWESWIYNTGNLAYRLINGNGTVLQASLGADPDVWHKVDFVWSYRSGTIWDYILYVDGVTSWNSNTSSNPQTQDVYYVCGGNAGNGKCGAEFAYAMVNNTSLTPEWIAAEYLNQATPSSFYTLSDTLLNYALIDCQNTASAVGLTVPAGLTGFVGNNLTVVRCPGGGFAFNESATLQNSIAISTGDDITIATGKTVTGTSNMFGDAAKAGAGTYTDVAGTQWNADPLFVSTSDFHLQSTSPAINAGVDVGLTTDYTGRPLPVGAGFDMGALEYSAYPLGKIGSGKPTWTLR